MIALLTFLSLYVIILAIATWRRIPISMVWGMSILAIALIHLASRDQSCWLRMIYLCSTLLLVMKWLVYQQWNKAKSTARSVRKLNVWRWLGFATLWFGMEPSLFAVKRRRREWLIHLWIGLACIASSGTAVWIFWLYEIDNLILLFCAMSLGFHFGVLRLQVVFWRYFGFPVKPLFRNPFLLKGFNDFWGRRWNLGYSQMMARTVKAPLTPIIGEKWSRGAVFLVSGIFHEIAITLPIGAGYGLPTTFFLIQGTASLLEKRNSILSSSLCVIFLLAGLYVLFPEPFPTEIILPTRDLFGALFTK